MTTYSPVKILRVINGLNPAFGGPSASSVNACLAEQRVGLVNTFCFAFKERHEFAAVAGRLESAGVTVHAFPLNPLIPATARMWGVSFRLLYRVIRELKAHDVVHVHGAWSLSSVVAVIAARLMGTPCVLSPHETLTEYDISTSRSSLFRLLKRALRRYYFASLTTIVFSSHLEMRDSRAPNFLGCVIGHAVVDETSLQVSPPRPVTESLVVGFLGRLHAKKRLDLAILALADGPTTATLHVAGDGDPVLRDALGGLATQLGIESRVQWKGFLRAAKRNLFLRSIDVLLMPSNYECFGMAAAEALAAGVPVLVSETTGIAELVERHECGWVLPQDHRAIADCLTALHEDRGELARRSAQSQRAVISELSFSHYGHAITRLYYRLLA